MVSVRRKRVGQSDDLVLDLPEEVVVPGAATARINHRMGASGGRLVDDRLAGHGPWFQSSGHVCCSLIKPTTQS